MRARYPGRDARTGKPIEVGDEIREYGRGWTHAGPPPSFAWTPRPTYDAIDDFERIDAERDRARDNAEYAAGINDANRWRENRAFFGDAEADRIEFERDMRGLNGEW